MATSLIRIILLLCFLNLSITLSAHPGIGMVYDGKNTIYFTDLENIWEYNITDGSQTILIPNIHSHELSLDNNGNLYGEHYYYLEKEQKFKNYIWKFSKEYGFTIIREVKDGENTDFSFLRDKNFNAYQFKTHEGITEIRKVFKDSSVLLHKQAFNDLRWKHINKEGILFFIDLYSLYRTDETGKTEKLADNLSSTKFPFSFNDKKHNIYGIWTDNNKNVYAAIYGGKEVKRIDKNNAVTTFYKSPLLWSPLNGLFDKKNNLWLMEGSIWGKTRIRLINQTNESNLLTSNSWLLITIMLILVLVYIRVKLKS